MPRAARVAPGGMAFHVLNRGNDRRTIFETDDDYRAFLSVVRSTQERMAMRLLAYCVMPNHWHLVLWPREDGDLGGFMQRLTTTHVRRWRLHRHSVGSGHVYQGTYKSFPVQTDQHFYTVARYVERNALRARLVRSAEKWPWGSLAQRSAPPENEAPILSPWPTDYPDGWLAYVNEPQTESELAAMRQCVQRGQPFGSPLWQKRTAQRLGLEFTFRPRGRPRKSK